MNRHICAAFAIFLATTPAVYSSGAGTPSVYQIEDLGKTSDGLVPTVTGINASGQVSGYVNRAGGLRAVRFTNGTGWAYLPGLDSVYSVATAINDHGDLTGYYFAPAGLRAFRYADGTLTTIDVLPGGSFTVGQAIAANGDIVGYGDSSLGQRAFRTGPGLGVLPIVPAALNGGTSSACAVNGAGETSGQMVGTYKAGTNDHAFRLETNGTLTDLGSLGGSSSSACGLDANGRVGGQSRVGTATHAFVFAGTLTDVHAFTSTFSVVEAVSNGVGVGMFNSSSGKRAFVHTDANGAIDLNSLIPTGSGWVLQDATAVNANGQIVGQGMLGTTPRAFRLTPDAPLDTTAPVIASVTANPSSIAPPDKRMVDVAFSPAVTDDHDPSPVCALSAADGHGAPSADFSITGPLAGRVRATGGATYSFTVTCSDAAHNASSRSVDVVVPADTTRPVFTSLSATPSTIWPPKGQMVTVTISASATDDSGETPACTLDGITGPGTAPADFNVTGSNTGSVKAVGGRTYTFNETCVDGSGNGAWSSVNVTVPADVTAPVIASLAATPSSVTPPNRTMVPVTVSVSATDDVDDAPACALSAITSAGAPAEDFAITGPLAAAVRAVGGRTYSLKVTCSDAAGNPANSSVDVVVPPDTTPPVVASVSATPSRIWPPKGQMVTVTTSASASDDSGEAPTCTLRSITGPGTSGVDFNVTGPATGSVKAVGGRTYTFNESCVDGSGNSASSSVDVAVPPDVTAPVIASLTATPSSIVPPNRAMVPVTVSVSATDDVDDAPGCALTAITSAGAPSGDSAITGPFSASVRAVGGRTYSLRVTCADAAGNRRDASVDVTVPPDTTAPVITSLSATPDHIWPPNNKMESVTLSVTATDDVDAAPACALTSITGAPATDAVITGPFSASVRSQKDAIYTLTVGCSDRAGNKSEASIRVAVSNLPSANNPAGKK